MPRKRVTKVKDRVAPEDIRRPGDRTHIMNRDPSKHYHWVNADEMRVIEMKDAGYEVVKRSDDGPQAPMLDAGRTDGIIGSKTMILMQTSKANRRKREKAKGDRIDRRTRRQVEEHVSQMARAGLISDRDAAQMVEEGVEETRS